MLGGIHLCEPTTACPAEAVHSPVSKSKLHDPSEHLAENFSEPERSKIGLERVFQLSEYPDSWVLAPGVHNPVSTQVSRQPRKGGSAPRIPACATLFYMTYIV
jgi:hypothetical protein